MSYLEVPPPTSLCFDEDAVTDGPGGGSASGPGPQDLARLTALLAAPDYAAALNAAWELLRPGGDWPVHVYRAACDMLAFVPILLQSVPAERRPCSPLECLEALWAMGMRYRDDRLLSACGHALQLGYEEAGRFADYRRINRELLAIAVRRGLGPDAESIRISNLGFADMKEGHWASAVEYFERAAAIMARQPGREVEYANMQLSLLISRFGARAWSSDAVLEEALTRWGTYLRERSDWRERKAPACLARVRETAGDLASAVAFMRRAVEIGATMNPMYLEADRAELARLEARQSGSGQGPENDEGGHGRQDG